MRISGSKITAPGPPPGHVPRPGLLERLGRAGAEQLVVVIAPPGYGKTALLAEWARRPGGPATAWVTADAGDDAPRLRAAVLAALRAVPGLPAGSPLREVGSAGGDRVTRDVIDGLVAAFDAAQPPGRVVVDDVHELSDTEALRDLTRLVRGHPAGLRLVLSGRFDPPLPLPRMRLEGRLHELRAQDLRFDVDETAAVLRASGVDLAGDQVALLHSRTGGWAAAVRLAALALRGRADPAAFVSAFSGSEGSVAGYLTDEVMTVLPEADRQFLRVCSVCEQLPADLAVALTGRADAARGLDDLARASALIERVPPRAYRIHTLLRSYLVAELARRFPALHRRADAVAARWWLAADEPEHALAHAVRTGDTGLVVELLREGGVRLVASGRLAAVRRAIAACGQPGPSDASTWLVAALVHDAEGAHLAAVDALEKARRAWPRDADAALGVVRSGVERLVSERRPGTATQPRPPAALAPDLEALRLLGDAVADARVAGTGDAGEALRARVDQVTELARESGFGYFEMRALALRADLGLLRGDYAQMTAAATAALAAAEAARDAGRPAPRSAGPVGLLAYGELLAGDPASAARRAEELLSSGVAAPPRDELVLRVVLRAAAADLGEPVGRHAGRRLAESGDVDLPAGLAAALALLEQRAALTAGRPRLAAETAEWLQRRAGKARELLLMDAWAHLEAGRAGAAHTALDQLVDGSLP